MKRPPLALLASVLPPLLLVLGLGLRWLGLPLVSLDMSVYLFGWYDTLAAKGFSAFREAFSNYTPPYLYLLALAALTRGLLAKVTAIKLIAILFDLLNVFLIYRLIRLKYPSGPIPALGAAGFFLLPTVILNSAWWGQADSIYTCFLLACLYFLLLGRPLPAMLALGLSFSFKAQAVFFAPFILLLLLRKKIPWTYLLLVPAVYLMMMIPAALAGRPWPDLLTIYLGQAGDYRSLSKNAPNLYAFLPDAWYQPLLIVGLVLAAVLILLWVVFYFKRIRVLDQPILLLMAFISVALVPFLLPKMHDRYFYPADVFSYLISFFLPSMRFAALGYQVISGLVYFVFLAGFTVQDGRGFVYLAALLNTLLIAWLLVEQYRRTAPALSSPDRLVAGSGA